jgi:hypothetical protein
MHIFTSHLLTARVTRNASIRPQHQLTSPVISLEKLYQRQPSATTNAIKHAAKTLLLESFINTNQPVFSLATTSPTTANNNSIKHTLLHFILVGAL